MCALDARHPAVGIQLQRSRCRAATGLRVLVRQRLAARARADVAEGLTLASACVENSLEALIDHSLETFDGTFDRTIDRTVDLTCVLLEQALEKAAVAFVQLVKLVSLVSACLNSGLDILQHRRPVIVTVVP